MKSGEPVLVLDLKSMDRVHFVIMNGTNQRCRQWVISQRKKLEKMLLFQKNAKNPWKTAVQRFQTDFMSLPWWFEVGKHLTWVHSINFSYCHSKINIPSTQSKSLIETYEKIYVRIVLTLLNCLWRISPIKVRPVVSHFISNFTTSAMLVHIFTYGQKI